MKSVKVKREKIAIKTYPVGEPEKGVSFVLDPETRRLGYSVKMRHNGLALLPPRGFMLLVR